MDLVQKSKQADDYNHSPKWTKSIHITPCLNWQLEQPELDIVKICAATDWLSQQTTSKSSIKNKQISNCQSAHWPLSVCPLVTYLRQKFTLAVAYPSYYYTKSTSKYRTQAFSAVCGGELYSRKIGYKQTHDSTRGLYANNLHMPPAFFAFINVLIKTVTSLIWWTKNSITATYGSTNTHNHGSQWHWVLNAPKCTNKINKSQQFTKQFSILNAVDSFGIFIDHP
jgi:hypothetical protein